MFTWRVAILGVTCWFVSTSAVADEPASWQISAREVPAPAGASEQLRASIAAMPVPDVAHRRSVVPHTRAQWDALIAQRKIQRSTSLAEVEKNLAVSIEQDTVAGVPVYHIRPTHLAPEHTQHLLFYVHGGAYVFGGGDASVGEAAIIASVAGIPALSVDYRMPPEHPFPAALDDAVSVYREVLKQHAPRGIAFGGTSAGGGLALAAVHQLKALDLPLPGAIYAGTPWADLTKTGDTLYTNEGLDRVLVTYDGSLGASARLYAAGRDLKDPLLSPVYGDFADFPATLLITGTRDMFLSDTARTHQLMRAAGVDADLHVLEALSHAGYLLDLQSPESKHTYQQVALFLGKHLR